MTADRDRALVVLSGGQDSTTCLYWAIERYGRQRVSALTFDYGQKHRIELDSAAAVANHARVRHTVLPIDTFSAIGGDALTDSAIDVHAEAENRTDLPATFVAGRNLVFLTYAAAYAYRHAVLNIVTGVAQTDFSGYPDCRARTIASLQETLRLGMEYDFNIHTPLMDRSKKQTVDLAIELGALEAMALTHTCYEGLRPPCGKCEACRLRAKGFADAGVIDPLLQ